MTKSSAGRKASSIRNLAKADAGISLDTPTQATALLGQFSFCPHCGCAWWPAHAVTYRDSDGIFAVVDQVAQEEHHTRTCMAYTERTE